MPRKNRQHNAGTVLAVFVDMLENSGSEDEGVEELAKFIAHCGIEIFDANHWTEDVLRHYRNPLGYDVEKVAHDLSTYPPIARRIWELQAQKAEELAAQEAARKRGKKTSRHAMAS